MEREEKLAWLVRAAPRIPFFSLVRYVTRLFPDAPPVGGGGPVEAEAIRFRHDNRLVFHAVDVAGLRVVHAHDRVRIDVTTTFLGIVGSVSPLANYFSEDVLRAALADDRTFAEFYDVFHHRLVAFVYRAILRGSPWAEVRTEGADRTSARLFSLTRQIPRGERAPLSARQELALARIFARRPRGRDGLEAALELAFPGVPIRVQDFLSRSVPLAGEQRAQLGVRHATLGRDARLGRHLPRQSGLLRILVGPLDRDMFDAFLPGGAAHARMRGLVASRTGGMLDCEMELEIRCGQEPRARLGAAYGTRLGTTSLVGRPRGERPVRARVPLTGDGSVPRPVYLAPPL